MDTDSHWERSYRVEVAPRRRITVRLMGVAYCCILTSITEIVMITADNPEFPENDIRDAVEEGEFRLPNSLKLVKEDTESY